MILKFCDICGKILPAGKSAGYFNKELGSFDFCDKHDDMINNDTDFLKNMLSSRSIELLKLHMKNSIDDAKLSNRPYIKKEEFDVVSSNV